MQVFYWIIIINYLYKFLLGFLLLLAKKMQPESELQKKTAPALGSGHNKIGFGSFL